MAGSSATSKRTRFTQSKASRHQGRNVDGNNHSNVSSLQKALFAVVILGAVGFSAVLICMYSMSGGLRGGDVGLSFSHKLRGLGGGSKLSAEKALQHTDQADGFPLRYLPSNSPQLPDLWARPDVAAGELPQPPAPRRDLRPLELGARPCSWVVHHHVYLGGAVEGATTRGSLEQSKASCLKYPSCRGVTCDADDVSAECTPRTGVPFLAGSPTGEVSYVKTCDDDDATKSQFDVGSALKPQSEPSSSSTSRKSPAVKAPAGETAASPADASFGSSNGAALSELPGPWRAVLVVIAHNNPSDLDRCLRSIVALDGAKSINLAVSLDDPPSFEKMGAVVRRFSSFKIDVWHRTPDTSAPYLRAAVSKISEHHRFALVSSFDTNGYEFAILLENDLSLAPDFFWYFRSTALLLEKDPSLFCVSGWNDNGFKGIVSDEKRLFRSDYFPGLGWMIKRDTWELLRNKWPRNPTTGWDHWLRHGSGLRPRECILPEVPRTHHFGTEGTNVHTGSGIQRLLARMETSALPPGQLGDLSYLLRDNYELHLQKVLGGAQLLQHGLKDLQSSLLQAGRVYILPYVREDYAAIARALGIISSQPRTAHRGIIVTYMPVEGAKGRATIVLVDRRQAGVTAGQFSPLPEAEAWHPHPARKVAAASPGQSCDAFCQTQGLVCDARELEFVNTCDEMRKAFPCEDGCGHQVGLEIPAFVHDRARDTARQCLVTDDALPQCKALSPVTTRLCVCIPPVNV
eukprot:TRINITY_DN8605_c1_g1_i1.p1 TRINITY_DN8605_c1_g1~~TRINITY_DN8605_c1_g1_i1.p1  ORF type:complete len:771 (+),score=92.56 TRINITY_DN8605_c1_g1_i1:83-2314(+)